MKLLGIEIHLVRKPSQKIVDGDQIKERGPFRRLRIGKPGSLFGWIWMILITAPIAVYLFTPESFQGEFIILWVAAVAIAVYIGVIVHEMMHALPYRGFREHTKVFLYPKAFFISGYLSVPGAIPYDKLQQSLWMPMWLGAALIVFTGVSYPMGIGWITEFLLMVSILTIEAGGFDMYWSWRTRKFGHTAKYYDRGCNLDIVWREE
jgi:hypothetical protein